MPEPGLHMRIANAGAADFWARVRRQKRAREQECSILELGSVVQRFAAPRFHLREHTAIVSHPVALELDAQ